MSKGSTMRTELGKIQTVHFGLGGYHDACIGISFTLSGSGWGVSDFWGTWAVKIDKHTKWTEAERITTLGETVMRISRLLSDAKVDSVHELKGIPVKVYFDGNVLKSWDVLKEVL